MRGLLVLALPFLLSSCASRRVQMKMAVEVLSIPEGAEIRYHGKRLGPTPTELKIESYDDIGAIMAAKSELPVVERRIRIVSADRLQVIFRLGTAPAPIAKRLGLTRVVIFEYAETVTFDTDSSELKPTSLPILTKQAEILSVYFPNANVVLCGFTDATGSDDWNDRLSLARAESVRALLVKNGIPAARLQARGFGKEFEAASNATPEGRARNRRTEVILPE